MTYDELLAELDETRSQLEAATADAMFAHTCYLALRDVWKSRHSAPLVYIAGPYAGRGDDTHLASNIQRAADEWFALARDNNVDAICPHVLGILLDPADRLGREWWLEHTKQLMLRCTHVLVLPGESDGTDAEVELAREVGIPVYHDRGELMESILRGGDDD